MSINYPKPHYGSTSEYQVSSWPYVTASLADELTTTPLRITFPYSTRWINIQNMDDENIRVGFSRNGVQATETANYFTVGPIGGAGDFNNAGNSSGILELKCSELWLRTDSGTGTFRIVAGLTNVKRGRFPVLTASDGPEGVTGGFIGVG